MTYQTEEQKRLQEEKRVMLERQQSFESERKAREVFACVSC